VAVHPLIAEGQAGVKGVFQTSQVIEALRVIESLRDPATWFLVAVHILCQHCKWRAHCIWVTSRPRLWKQRSRCSIDSNADRSRTARLRDLELCLLLMASKYAHHHYDSAHLIRLTGMALMYALDSSNQAGRMAGFCLSLALQPICLSACY
jgi:hypothetical protein